MSLHTSLPTAVSSVRLQTYAFYLISNIIALLLVLSTPNTRLWSNSNVANDQSTGALNQEALAELLFTVIGSLLCYWCVQGSDPGYITKDLVDDVVAREEDGLGVGLDEVSLITGNTSDGNGGGVEMRTRGGGNSEHDDNDGGSEEGNLEGRLTWHGGAELGPTYKGYLRKQCFECGYAPPLRSHHCKVCNRCVATFDHHCFFINTCIGERNHCRFLVYCAAQAAACWVAVSIINSGHVQAKHIPASSTWLEKNGMVIVSSLFVWPLALFSTVMFIIHSFLAISNTTTFEVSGGSDNIDYLKGTKECDLPFSKGLDGNMKLFCCARDKAWSYVTGDTESKWTPIVWRAPKRIVRDSEDWWEHPWENKYWSCC